MMTIISACLAVMCALIAASGIFPILWGVAAFIGTVSALLTYTIEFKGEE